MQENSRLSIVILLSIPEKGLQKPNIKILNLIL